MTQLHAVLINAILLAVAVALVLWWPRPRRECGAVQAWDKEVSGAFPDQAESLSIAGTLFPVLSDARNALYLGGWCREMRQLSDGGESDTERTRPWRLAVVVALDVSRQDVYQLMEWQHRGDPRPICVELASGSIHRGKGWLVKSTRISLRDLSALLIITGDGEFEQQ